jgi:SET domain-containing protein
MLVPMVDMLNHDSENPNVGWKWHVGEEKMVDEGKGDIAVTTLRDVKKGEELCKCYGK